jgi:hypothetical protein
MSDLTEKTEKTENPEKPADTRSRQSPQSPQGERSGQNRGLQTKHIVLILGCLLIIAAAVVAVILLTGREAPNTNISGIPVINPDNLADVEADIREKVEKGMFATHMNTVWTFPDGKSPSDDAVMGNSGANSYPFWFEVTVDGETVFTSDLLPVGTQIKEIILDKDLDAGEYAAVLSIHMVDDTNNNEPIESNMGFNITLFIQN